MRDKLINSVAKLHRKYPMGANPSEHADAIIAALPDMMKPLEWEAEEGNPSCEDAQGTGIFYRVLHRVDGMGLMRINGSRNDEVLTDSPEAAKAAAQAHHVAQVLHAFGITPPDAGKEE